MQLRYLLCPLEMCIRDSGYINTGYINHNSTGSFGTGTGNV